GSTVLALATDGKDFQLLDARANRFLVGEAGPCTIARVIRVELAPADAVAVILGGAPLPASDVPADQVEVGWDAADGGREVLTLKLPGGAVETIKLDAREHRWDVTEAERRGADGKVEWR